MQHFLKAILPSPIHDKQLRIPKEFIRRFGNELSSFATISVPDGRTWEMRLKKCGGGGGGDVFFCNNWQQFAKYYSIGYGSYLVFKYEGNSKFSVVIFDSTSAEISYPPNKIETTSNSSTASERAKAAADEFKTNNPSFVSTIKNKRVYIPLEFAPKYLKPDVHLNLQNSTSNGQIWKAYCKCHDPRSSAMRIEKGFAKFAKDNDLLDGDTCVFELIKREHPVLLQVTSFRAADYATN